MKIIELLPELDIGGVERHVIDLTSELALRGHELLVISAGGKMAHQLSPQVRQLTLPVHRKNPITGWLCACRIASLAKAEGWQLLHAHVCRPGLPCGPPQKQEFHILLRLMWILEIKAHGYIAPIATRQKQSA